jgi:outer membrane receptor protein involved in Fe transport
LLTLAQDAPTNENGIMYDPATGQQKLWNWDAASRTFGLFVEDTWKARRNLTLTLGLRYDDSGNPSSKSATTVFGNFYLGAGATPQDRVASGAAKATKSALLHSVNNLFSPRVGFAWDPTGNGDWVVRGGFGI